jgi:hypothetical protein
VLNSPVISDNSYDILERELKQAVEQFDTDTEYSAQCPTKIVGSSFADDYSEDIKILAMSFLE